MDRPYPIDGVSRPADVGISTSLNRYPSNILKHTPHGKGGLVGDPIGVRKVQKADREKLRRDRLNEHFVELACTIGPGRARSDKATIVTDAIQLLKDLTGEVEWLRENCSKLSGECRELLQEKDEVREERASLRSDLDSLNAQYQQRFGVVFPWTSLNPSIVLAHPYSFPPPPPYSSLRPFHHMHGSHHPVSIVDPLCSTHAPYSSPSTNDPRITQQSSSSSYASSSIISQKRRSEFSVVQGPIEVATELELKMPGSCSHNVSIISRDEKKEKRKKKKKKNKEGNVDEEGTYSSADLSHYPEGYSSNTVVGPGRGND